MVDSCGQKIEVVGDRVPRKIQAGVLFRFPASERKRSPGLVHSATSGE